MARPRVIMAEFQHETNCFSPDKSGRHEFEDRLLIETNALIPFYTGTRAVVGGFIDAATEENFELIPVIAAFAEPGGLVTGDIYEFVKGKIVDAIKNTRNVDGVLLCLHGAMVVETTMDAEGDLLKAVRDAVGPYMPIVTSLDLHGNVSSTMVENASAFFCYETYPHIDGYERGYEAGKYLAKMMRGQTKPVMKLKHVPILSHLVGSGGEPHTELLKKAHKWEERPEVIEVATMHGFPWSDVPDATVSVVVVTDDDSQLADEILDDMAGEIWRRRDQFYRELLSPEAAVKEAMEFPEGPVIIADSADNPGGGGACDSTFVLRALIKAGAKNVGLALIPDRQSVQRAIEAGIGSKVKLNLGGKSGPAEKTGGPLEITGTVKTIFDGEYVNKGPMETGVLIRLGRSVVLDSDGIEVIITELRRQPWDAEVFYRAGINPKEKKIIALKSTVHFKGSFGPFAKKIVTVDTPCYVTMDFESLDFKHVPRPVTPLDKDIKFNNLTK